MMRLLPERQFPQKAGCSKVAKVDLKVAAGLGAKSRAMSRWMLVTVFLLCVVVQAEDFTIEEGGQSNHFLDVADAQVHLLLRPGRLIFAFPAENSGHGLWFQGDLQAVAGSLRALPGSGARQMVTAKLRVLGPTTVERVLLDSIRTLRDHSEGSDTAARISAGRLGSGAAFAEARQSVKGNTVRYARRQRFTQPDAGEFQLEIAPVTIDALGRVVLLPGEVSVTASLPYPPMRPFLAQGLYRADALAEIDQSSPRLRDSLRALNFLARQEKLMAGSWRFLTYFGRDTLISLSMLEPLLSDQALLAGIESVLVRLSPEGMVAHEEDIGPWAEWRHLQAGQASAEPVYDHKMVDDDLLLPVLLRKLSENGRGQVVLALLADPENRQALLRNATYTRSLLARKSLIRLNPGESTGDWRDSHEGLGGGVFPASVNCDLALASIDGLAVLYEAMEDKESLAELEHLKSAWRDLADQYWVQLSPEEIQSRLDRFGNSLNAAQKAGFDKLRLEHGRWENIPFRFPVLSLRDDGTPVVVPHTDVAFTLFYGSPRREDLEAILALLDRPFPYGLATPAGHLVASPVFSPDTDHYRSLGFGQYHGLVVWSWPMAMLQLGLLRQLDRFPDLDPHIKDLLDDMALAEQRVGPLATSELWAIELDSLGITWRAYGVQGDQAESNALQLWSTVYPALHLARRRAGLK
jgi:hypothetical protein